MLSTSWDGVIAITHGTSSTSRTEWRHSHHGLRHLHHARDDVIGVTDYVINVSKWRHRHTTNAIIFDYFYHLQQRHRHHGMPSSISLIALSLSQKCAINTSQENAIFDYYYHSYQRHRHHGNGVVNVSKLRLRHITKCHHRLPLRTYSNVIDITE